MNTWFRNKNGQTWIRFYAKWEKVDKGAKILGFNEKFVGFVEFENTLCRVEFEVAEKEEDCQFTITKIRDLKK